ncbi:hypothetical protein H8R17_13615 [Streptomyces sp. TRM68367]|nr:hypothetical protein [Streptomyces sp. TRM68367]
MDPDHLVRACGGHAQFHDGEGGGVRREQRVLPGDDPVQLGEQLDLDLLVLRRRLHHQVPVGQFRKVRGDPHPVEGGVAFRSGELAASYAALQRSGDPGPAGSGRARVHLVHHHVQPGPGADLGDARAHQAAADDPDPADAGPWRVAHRNAAWPVSACPIIRVCISTVPS